MPREFRRVGRPQSDGAEEAAPRTHTRLLVLLFFLAAIALVGITGLGVINYKIWKAERQIGSAIGDLRQEQKAYGQALGQTLGQLRQEQQLYAQALGQALGELRQEQHSILPGVEARLRDLDASSTSLRNDVDAIASHLGVKYSPKDININSLDDYDNLDQNWRSFRDTADRIKISCVTSENTAVIVTLGQSNAANYGTVAYTPKYDVMNFDIYDGNCYRARDPLLGASGTGGNFATPLADILIQQGLFERVIVAPIAMGGSTVEQWADEGRFNRRMLVLVRRLFDAGLKPTYILWHQGEGDPGDGDSHGRQYRKNLLEVISTFRRYGIAAPFFVALATKCGAYPRPNGDNIRDGQRSAINPLMNVFLGPDTDQLGDDYRDPQHCHFNAAGLQRHAEMWADILRRWTASSSAKE
jgi:hypothetical protein